MTARKKIFTAAGCVVFIILLTLTIKYVWRVVERKECINENAPFFEHSDDYDVLFFGSSHVACSISPMDLWNDYGITSYNFGNSGESLPVTYWTMEMSLERCTPELAVIDVFYVLSDARFTDDDVNSTHNSWDCYPLSSVKIKAINDLIEDKDTRLEYMFDIGKYHTRWEYLTWVDFVPYPSRSNGIWAYGGPLTGEYLVSVSPQAQYVYTNEKNQPDETIAGIVYLRKIIESCRSRGIEVLLICNPYVADEEAQKIFNAVQDIADEYGVNYINFISLNSVVDYGVDMMDQYHTNVSGLKKVTYYLGDYIKNHYDIADRRNDDKYKYWYNDYDSFVDWKIESINAVSQMTTVLEMLYDNSFSCTVKIRPGTEILDSPTNKACLQNLVREKVVETPDNMIFSSYINPLPIVEYAAATKTGYILNVDNVSGTFTEELYEEEPDPNAPSVQISIIDNRNGEIVSERVW